MRLVAATLGSTLSEAIGCGFRYASGRIISKAVYSLPDVPAIRGLLALGVSEMHFAQKHYFCIDQRRDLTLERLSLVEPHLTYPVTFDV